MDIGDIVTLKVVDYTNFGYFLDWGKDDDILLPNSESFSDKKIGDSTTVIICIDRDKNRYFVSERIEDKLTKEVDPEEFKDIKLVDGLVYASTPLGYKVCFNKKYTGLLYRNEVFQDIEIGDKVKLYIKSIRADGKVDLILQKQGYKNVIVPTTDSVLEKLKESNGVLDISDSSSPEEIYALLGMSKKTFKKAIGKLYKERKIKILEDRITLV